MLNGGGSVGVQSLDKGAISNKAFELGREAGGELRSDESTSLAGGKERWQRRNRGGGSQWKGLTAADISPDTILTVPTRARTRQQRHDLTAGSLVTHVLDTA